MEGITRKQILESLVNCAHENGRVPTYQDYDNCVPWTSGMVCSRIGSWPEVLERSELPAVPNNASRIVREYQYIKWCTDGEGRCDD